MAAPGDGAGHRRAARAAAMGGSRAPAAAHGQVRTAVHATAGASPEEVLARTNRLLTDLNPGLFTSCLYAQLDLARHVAHLAVAGHPPPLLRHPDGHTEILDLPPGLLLGIEPDAKYQTTTIPLPPGSVLALFTDGLVETPGLDIEDCMDDLGRQLAQADIRSMDKLADDLLDHARQAGPRNDDIALLLVAPQGGGRAAQAATRSRSASRATP